MSGRRPTRDELAAAVGVLAELRLPAPIGVGHLLVRERGIPPAALEQALAIPAAPWTPAPGAFGRLIVHGTASGGSRDAQHVPNRRTLARPSAA